ncbi:biotin/lipoyl-binding protein [Mesorhizobium silamurunense]|uniref:biotin/lipoyl-binding protein n=1 Tax=Mesorhizobium silamurunense TaxID=499528 RepID=UPI0028A8F69C|nr:biotin/lipoyl-binding protein [Mesorhizobium silamurunense]
MVFAIASATGSFERKTRDPVLTEPVVLGSVEETVLANGVLEPARMVSVGAQVSGRLKALHVVLGQTIKAGDLIAEIDATQQQNELRIADANLANVKAQRKESGIELEQAELVFRRQKTLSGQKAASAAELADAQAKFLALEAKVESFETQIAEKTVGVENARAKLDYTKVSAPMDGVVVAVVTKVGQTLNSTQAVPTIVKGPEACSTHSSNALVIVHNGKILRAYREPSKFPYLSAGKGAPVSAYSLLRRRRHEEGVPSEIDETDAGVWLSVQRGRTAPQLYEQVLTQRDGFAMIMLSIEPSSEEDEDPEDELNFIKAL